MPSVGAHATSSEPPPAMRPARHATNPATALATAAHASAPPGASGGHASEPTRRGAPPTSRPFPRPPSRDAEAGHGDPLAVVLEDDDVAHPPARERAAQGTAARQAASPRVALGGADEHVGAL